MRYRICFDKMLKLVNALSPKRAVDNWLQGVFALLHISKVNKWVASKTTELYDVFTGDAGGDGTKDIENFMKTEDTYADEYSSHMETLLMWLHEDNPDIYDELLKAP